MTEYSSQYRYEDGNLRGDLRDLDWDRAPNHAVEQAAAIIQESWGPTRPEDEGNIREALSDVPRKFHEPVLQAVIPETASRSGKERADYRELTSDHESFQNAASLKWELELTQPAMRYLEDIGRDDLVHRLEALLRDNRTMEAVRELPGDPLMYGSDVREKYIQAVADIPAAIHAKEDLSGDSWGPEEVQAAAAHEVNRMGYRMNLEVQDRLMTMFSYGRQMSAMAERMGMSESAVELVRNAGEEKLEWRRRRRLEESPVASRLEDAAMISVLEIHLLRSIRSGDEAGGQGSGRTPGLLRRSSGRGARAPWTTWKPQHREIMEAALEIARSWPDEDILDGSHDHHAAYAPVDYRDANVGRRDWLQETGQQDRRELAGDCIARALNEARGRRELRGHLAGGDREHPAEVPREGRRLRRGAAGLPGRIPGPRYEPGPERAGRHRQRHAGTPGRPGDPRPHRKALPGTGRAPRLHRLQ